MQNFSVIKLIRREILINIFQLNLRFNRSFISVLVIPGPYLNSSSASEEHFENVYKLFNL